MCDIPTALDAVDAAIADQPTAAAYVVRAKIMASTKDIKQAKADFSRAQKLEPRNVGVFYNRAQFHCGSRNFVEAIRDYKKCIKIDPDFGMAHLKLAECRYNDGVSRVSTEIFDTVLDKFSHMPQVHNYYGLILLQQGMFKDAKRHFERAIEFYEAMGLPSVSSYCNKAEALYRLETSKSEAFQLRKRAVGIDPQDYNAVEGLAKLYSVTNNWEEGSRLYFQAAELTRDERKMNDCLKQAELLHVQSRLVKERLFIWTKALKLLAKEAFEKDVQKGGS